MSKLIRIRDNVMLELDKVKVNSYSNTIEQLLNSKQSVNNTLENKLDTILNKLQSIIEIISSKSNY